MTDSLYLIYQNDTIKLIGSFIIKSVSTAEAVNRGIIYNGGTVNVDVPSSWRYYNHLAGIYHSADTPMQIISHDTQSIIDFTKSNLLLHKSTAINYAKDPQYINALITQYPEQINLIKGILYPIDLQVAINAEDGAILYYDPTLIDDNESTLMADIQDSIYAIMGRWYIEDYTISDELYPAVFYGMLTASLIAITMNHRLNRCNTIEAHTYHIREYLASRNGLDRYTDALYKKQLLWLYRNINYIRNNIGKQEILDALIANILTPRNIPVGEFHIEQNIEALLETGLPTGELVSFPINTQSSGIRDRFLTIEQMLIKERGIAKGNEDAEHEFLPKTESLLARSGHNTLPTKILESVMVDFGEYSPVVLTDTLYHYWGYLSSIGQYTTIIEVTIGGQETLLSALDAYVLYTYALYKAADITLTDIPTFYANNILKANRPTLNQLKAIVDSKYVSDAKLLSLLADIPEVGTHISSIGFFANVVQLHKRFKQHRLQYAQETDGKGRGMVDGAANHLYYTIPIVVADETTYTEWLGNRALDFSSLTKDEWFTASIDIFKKATGYVEDKSLAEIQESLITLVEQLTSYTIQWIYEINHSRIIPLDTRTLRITDPYLLPFLRGRIRPNMDYKLESARVHITAEMGEPMPMVAHLTSIIKGIMPPSSLPGLTMNPVINIRAPLPVYDFKLAILEEIIEEGDDEEIIDYIRTVLDLPFSESSLGAIIDHSESSTPMSLFTFDSFHSHVSIDSGVLKVFTTDETTSSTTVNLPEAYPIPKAPIYWELEFTIGWNGVLSTTISDINIVYLFNKFASTLNVRVEAARGLVVSLFGNTSTVELISSDSMNYAGTFKLTRDDNVIKLYRNSTVVATQTLTGIVDLGIPKLRLLYANNGGTQDDSVVLTVDNVYFKYRYHGTPWWVGSLLCLNFEQQDPDSDPGLVMSGASGTYTNAFVTDQSPCKYKIGYGYGTSRDLVISRDYVDPTPTTARLRYMSTANASPDYIKVIDFYIETGSLSIEFTYSHNKPSGNASSADTMYILEITNGDDHNLSIQHNGDNKILFNGVGDNWSSAGYIVNPPQEEVKYTINIGPASKEVYMNGVLALSSSTGFTFSKTANNTVQVLRSTGGADSTGRVISLRNVIVTNNYLLDPNKNRVIPN